MLKFEEWFEGISKENLSNKTLKELLEFAYKEGAIAFEKEMPLYGKNVETGEIIELPREENESLLPKDEVWSEEDVDLESWLKEKGDNKNESK